MDFAEKKPPESAPAAFMIAWGEGDVKGGWTLPGEQLLDEHDGNEEPAKQAGGDELQDNHLHEAVQVHKEGEPHHILQIIEGAPGDEQINQKQN